MLLPVAPSARPEATSVPLPVVQVAEAAALRKEGRGLVVSVQPDIDRLQVGGLVGSGCGGLGCALGRAGFHRTHM